VDAAPPKPEFPLRFVIVTFGVAVVVLALIVYFGVTGQIGGPVP
jgi:hypothetical protein